LVNLTVNSLAIDPDDPDILYAGTFGGGVFKSTDGGNSWIAVNTGLTNSYILSLAIDPVNPNILYAGSAGIFVLEQAPLTVLTGSASSITQTTAILNGSVNPNGSPTTAWLEWGTTSAYGNQTSSQSLGSGTTSVSLSESLTNLLPNTTYHFRVVLLRAMSRSST
jgi:hypothetical protein